MTQRSDSRSRPSLSAVALAASLLLSCSPTGEPAAQSHPQSSAPAHAGVETASGSGSGSGLGNILGGSGVMQLASLVANLEEPGIYDAPRESENFSDSKPHLVTMNLAGAITELESASLLSSDSGTPLRVLQDRLRSLATTANVSGLLLRVGDLHIAMAEAQELRASLLAFKKSGKTLYCHTESASNVQYYLLTACSSIALAPTGGVVISGVAAMPMHLKGLLDKLGIKADFLHVGAFKGAAEPLTLDKPSDAMKTTIAGILDQRFASLVKGIAQGRELSPAAVRESIDTAMFTGPEAIAAKLVDEESTYEAYRAKSAGTLAWKTIAVDANAEKEAGLSKLFELVGLAPRTRNADDHIAVVYAVGNIVDGAGDGIIGARSEIASSTLVAALRALQNASSVKGVLLRIDSGGGSALASEIIWHAVHQLRQSKPVVVSMGGVAASGGYYISAGANRIFADENTLTGSIGVVGGKLAVGGALEKIGIKSFPVGRGKRALMWRSLGAWNADQRAAVQKMMEDIYKIFVQRVADGRGKSYADIHKIAQGRVWTGKAALANGLVDEIGGFDAALAHLTVLAGMQTPGELEIYPPEPNLSDFVGSYLPGVSTSTSTSTSMLQRQALAEVRLLLGSEPTSVIAHALEQIQSFRKASMQTTMILPVAWQ